jgi:hypothetical protein
LIAMPDLVTELFVAPSDRDAFAGMLRKITAIAVAAGIGASGAHIRERNS